MMKQRKEIFDINLIESIKVDPESSELTMNKVHGENWSVFVSDNSMLTKLKRLMKGCEPGYVRCFEGSRDCDGRVTGYFFEINERCIGFKSGKKKAKVNRKPPSEEEKAAKREAFIERTRKAREAKKLAQSNKN